MSISRHDFFCLHFETFPSLRLFAPLEQVHENVKYLPEVKLPDNVIADPDLAHSVHGATILVFVVPHQFLKKTLLDMKPHVHPEARSISLIKVE
jgi:glycerol-3-phosphate dehydrogenase (NAD+)